MASLAIEVGVGYYAPQPLSLALATSCSRSRFTR